MSWKIQLPTGEFLDSVPDLSLELNNQVFSSGDTTVIPGSFSFPATLPLSNRNKVLLNNPQLVNNAAQWRRYEGCWVYCYNEPMFYGTLTITNATDVKCTISVVANPVAKLKEANLGDIDLGENIELTGSITDHMKDTAERPSDYNYAFFPVLIENIPIVVGTPHLSYHNYYDQDGTETFNGDSYAITPYIRLDYLLSRILTLEDTGFTFINAWQTELELKRLYVFNNRDLRSSNTTTTPAIPSEFNLKDHVPKVKVTDALKSVMSLFCLGLFTNIFSRTLKLASVRSLLQRAPKYDWTAYAIADAAIDPVSDAPNYFKFEPDPDPIPPEWPRPEDCIFVATETEFYLLYDNPSSVGLFFYIETRNWISHITGWTGSALIGEVRYAHLPVVLDTKRDKPYNSNYTPPLLSMNMGEVSRWEEESTPGLWKFQYREPGFFGLIPYRGMVPTSGNPFPSTSQSGWFYNPPELRSPIVEDGVITGYSQYSLNWAGEYGLYNQWHAQFNEMLRTGKPCTQSFIIPVSVLTEFSFEDKIRVGQMEYFLRRIQVKKTMGNGMILITASMLTTI